VDVSTVRQWVVLFSSGDNASVSLLLVQVFMSTMYMLLLVASKKCIANGGDYAEKECFVGENFLYQAVLLYSLYLL